MVVKAKKKYGFEPDYAIAPGETLLETMESLDMSQKELAKRTELTVQSLNRIAKGEQPITYETANRLELATGVPSSIWNNLESQYREQLAKIEERERLKVDLEWLKTIPVNELVERNIVQENNDKIIQLREALMFFGVTSADSWKNIWAEPAIAARRSACFETRPGPASAWIRIGELEAQKIACKDFDKSAFRSALTTIRKTSTQRPTEFIPQMVKLCANSGVSLVFVPRLKKVPWHGATKWLSPTKAMILLSIRGKFEDLFWFSFFHEAGHILHDSKKDLLINDGNKADPREVRADQFAADFLIPEPYNAKIKNAKSKVEIVSIAKELQIAPGIVVGRFHHLTKRWKLFNDLKNKFKWA